MERLHRLGCVLVLLVAAGCTDAPTLPSAPSDVQMAASESPVYNEWTEVQSCDDTSVYCLNPVYPRVPGGPTPCDPWLDLNWCDDGEFECVESIGAATSPDYQVIASCPPGGYPAPPGGGPPPGDPPSEPTDTTCLTGEPALDTQAVRHTLDSLWRASNASAAQAQRMEHAVWIILNANGSYTTAAFNPTRQGPCNVNGNLHAPPGAVAWLHTHPFTTGEVMTICGALKRPDPTAPGGFRDMIGPDGRPVYAVYDNKPSIPDRELMNDVNALRSRLGLGLLVGVVIDANQTTVYTENVGDGNSVFPRCGY